MILPLIWLGLAITAGVIIYNSTKDKLEVSDESNCNDEFLLFDQSLAITPSKKKQLIAARTILQKKIKDYFNSKPNVATPTFYIQGSYKHDTIIRKQDDTCDIDVGVYFGKRPTINPLSIHKHIVSAIGIHTNEKATIKNKCIRVYYSNKFHIDLPIYYSERNSYFIGIGDSGWREDDPRLFTNWLKENTSDNSQKIRLIKYFKAWADLTKTKLGQKMPSGLALTIWIITYFEKDEREDLAFMKTAISLRNYLNECEDALFDWECDMPTIPGDSVIERLNEYHRENFLLALDTLIENCTRIVGLDSKEECLAEWRVIFGKWF